MQTAPIRLVVLGDVQAELQTSLYQCGPSARHRPGHPYPAPISLRVASNSADTLALVQVGYPAAVAEVVLHVRHSGVRQKGML